MQKFRLLFLAILCTTFGFSQITGFSIESALNSPITFGEPEYGTDGVTEGTLYSNGPYFNVAGSPDVSFLQDASLSMDTYGFGHALSTGYRVADDWVVTADVEVDSFQFYSYQTGSSTTSTINFVSLAIWDGDPSNPASTIVWGDQTTNVLTSSEWSGAYRQLESTPGATDRPIMISTVETPGLTLAPGTYWLDWQTGGTLGSGPWAPPITITGQATTGNAKQFNGASWADIIDGIALTAQGLPFEVNGEEIGGGGDDLLIIDLTTENQVTITATSAASSASASGSTTTGFIFENFFASAGTQAIGTTTYVGTPTLTAASVPTDNSPSIFRGSNTDNGLNIWSYSATGTTTFTSGSQAFTGEATWSITPELYAAMLTAPASGNIYFPADTSDDIPSATLLGTYSVIFPGVEPPGGDCDITYEGSLEDGLGQLNLLALASDFNISADNSMSVEKVTLNMLSNTSSVNVSFHADNAGTPGTQIVAPMSIVPTSQTLVGNVNGFNVYEVVLDLPTAQNFEGGASGANYWMAISTVVGTEGTSNYWEFSDSINNGTNFFYSVDGGATWADAGPAGFVEDGAFILEGTCNGEEEPEDGCFVTGTFDQWPSGTFVPSCLGIPEAITTAGWAGEFSKVQVTAGTEYIFTSSVTTDFITIADEDEEIAFATGTGSVTWTSPIDQVIRFYTHVDDDCTIEEISRTRAVQCGEEVTIDPPDYPCYQGDGLESNGFEDGYNVTAGGNFRNADDFIVDDTFTMQYVRLNLFMLPGDTASSVTFNVRADDGGAPSESNIVDSFTAVPTSQFVVGSNFGYNISQVEFVLDADRPELPAGTYWLQPEVTNGGGVAFWEVTTTGSLGGFIHTSELGGAWNANSGYQAVFFVAGVCGDTPPEEDCSQSTPSNDFENGHGNLHLLKVANDFVVEENTMFTVDQFKFNVILPAGATVDALDFYFYEDTGAGPGAELHNDILVVPTSVEMVGTLSSFEVSTVTVDLPTAYTFNGVTSGDTAYWLGIMVYTGAANSYWEGTSILNTPNEGYLELDGVWASISSTFGSAPFDGVYEISGSCETLGVSDMDSFDFAYYPNPVKDVLNITSNKPVENVAVFNLAGQKVLANAQVSNGQINVSALPAGVYVFKATLQGGQVETFKIIKK